MVLQTRHFGNFRSLREYLHHKSLMTHVSLIIKEPHRIMDYKELKATPPIVIGNFWPTSEPLSAVLGTSVLWV